MEIIKTIEEVKKIIGKWKSEDKTIGFIPTMGYLHEGHQSLMKSASENDKKVVSIFVNPTQFAPNEDLDKYPRDLERDIEICKEENVDLLFVPDVIEMYNNNFSTYINVENLSENLCGESRPGHFRGVCTVVNKLFNIVKPDKAYFGQKDAQQLIIIKKMVRDLNMDVDIISCPIIREEDGLAKSSRNKYLDTEERKAALILNSSLKKAFKEIQCGEKNPTVIINNIKASIKSEPLAKIDYVKIVDLDKITDISEIKKSALVAIAVKIGKTRLIDNFII